jgi:hypothetical protein
MPDHLHLLARGLDRQCDLRRFAKRAKQLSAYHARRTRRVRLWQPGYYDRVIRYDEEPGYVEYIRMNPVCAGLVERPEDYPHTFVCDEYRQTAPSVPTTVTCRPDLQVGRAANQLVGDHGSGQLPVTGTPDLKVGSGQLPVTGTPDLKVESGQLPVTGTPDLKVGSGQLPVTGTPDLKVGPT